MKHKICLYVVILSCFTFSCRKNKHDVLLSADVAWKKTWGSKYDDATYSMIMAKDGSVVVLGSTDDSAGIYWWAVNFDNDGNKKWETSFKNHIYNLTSITGSSDGGYVFAGGGIIKLDKVGKIVWETEPVQSYAPSSSIAATADGGYILGGGIDNIDFGVDYWILKVDGNGNKEWERTLGAADGIFSNSNSTGVSCVAGTADGGCIVVGSNLTSVFSYFQGNSDFMIIKLNSRGEIEWKRSYGGSEQEEPASVACTEDGGYVVAGSASSHDGDVEGVRIGASNYYDVWVLKLDKLGGISWQKTLGGWEDDKATSLAVAPDGGYIIGGTTSSNSGDVSGNHGFSDCWIVKLDSYGQLAWQKTLGGINTDVTTSVAASPGGQYFLAGIMWSNDGDASGNSGLSDAFVAKITK